MPVPTDMVGDTIDPITHEVDARWTMSYSASLGDTDPCYLDTRRTEGVMAHPVFPVCVEWPVIVSGRERSADWGITPDETRRSVHSTHDMIVHRLVRPGDTLTTSLTYAGVEQRKPGAYSTLRLETTDADGQPICTTYQGGIHLGVETSGENRPDLDAPAPLWEELGSLNEKGSEGALPETPLADIAVPVPANAAHNYTEGARIWNPIHTDAAVAEKAGLPAIILHGTATLALGVSAVLRELAPGQPELVRRICGRFAAMVLMPSTLTVRIHDEVEWVLGQDLQRAVRFQVLTEDGSPAVDQGVVLLDG